ncbi:tetratricopeptide repeat protein [Aquabacterium sp. A7-Y]|uniref:tetratricopeptide repeat protein n=1 Tax=Aquabacterium sp. A7-Y TaxID=1349605 RepID=UPI00223E4438|nr:tetratricopeptide repeat protein [Aquabacterium sp. A7-Y]MCW7538582.1 tetratricopeptide repeat protein [Aquabacterium sp. A7-Y]
MRYVELLWRSGGPAALCAALAACSSLDGLLPGQGAAAAPPGAGEPAPVASKAQPSAPVDPGVQRAFDEARRALAAGRTEEAERGFLALTRSHPELGGPHANLGLIHRRAGKLAQAVAALEQAVRASPAQPLYFNQLGIAYRQQGEFAKARAAYEQAIALDPAYAAPQLNLGILHDLYLGDGPRALERYDRYLALSPGGDAAVVKWVADLKNRKPSAATASRKEKE